MLFFDSKLNIFTLPGSSLNENHVVCNSSSVNKNFIELFLNTGCDINLIKINTLKGDTIVYKKEKLYLRGINEKIVSTIGRITIN